jgi:FkbM family methyltransferase
MLIQLARKLRTIGNVIESIAYRNLRRSGGRVGIYKSLNHPWLIERRFKTILDIGANTGQFASSAQLIMPSAKIYCFEPLPTCFRQLSERFQKAENVVCYNYGLGSDSAEIPFFENQFSPSSSFLPTTDRQTDAFPHTQSVTPVLVSVKRLDDIAADLNIVMPLLIKIDVQGYELPVILGGQTTIQQADMILVETSFVELYEGQALFSDVYDVLTQWGFRYAGALDQFVDPKTGEILQSDSVFLANR